MNFFSRKVLCPVRRIFPVVIGLVFVFSLACSEESGRADDSFSFVFMTDIHLQRQLEADRGFRMAIDSVNELSPDFVITGGDMVMDALGVSHERAAGLYDLYEDMCQEFEMPVYNTIGNHEVFGLYSESGVDSSHPQYGKEMFRQRIGGGRTYYSFDHKGWHFMIIDAVGFTPERRYIGRVDSAQIEWIKRDLQRVGLNTPIIISTHIPFVSACGQARGGGTAALRPGEAVDNSHKVINLFKDHDLRLVLQGHLHLVEEIIFKEIHYITGGAVSGRWWRGSRDGFDEGFVVIDIEGDSITWKYVTYGWKAVE